MNHQRVFVLAVFFLAAILATASPQERTNIENQSQEEYAGESFLEREDLDSNSSATHGIKVNSKELHLSPRFKINARPRTRSYVFEITNQTAALDGTKGIYISLVIPQTP